MKKRSGYLPKIRPPMLFITISTNDPAWYVLIRVSKKLGPSAGGCTTGAGGFARFIPQNTAYWITGNKSKTKELRNRNLLEALRKRISKKPVSA